ncbi:MAG: histone deacetylase family protein [Spirochaetia bacterium]|jgi:acetoin utilization deacetylase AcuC-like enzyme|nr:histone deacetylase family protein [Spirochaetia bacterium]
MFKIRKIYDMTSPANHDTIEQVREILRAQFPLARKKDFDKIPKQLHNPLKYRYRSILFVAENGKGKVRGFAMLLHMSDVEIGCLELISTAPGKTGGGVGGILYDQVREEAKGLKLKGLFFECSVDDPEIIKDPALLAQNRARLKFYERLGVRPIINNVYASPVHPGDQDLYYLMFDDLGREDLLDRKTVRIAVKAILERKYGDLIPDNQINEVVKSFKDDPCKLRERRYTKTPKVLPAVTPVPGLSIQLIVNKGHDIHHVKTRGYVEAPVRISTILTEIDKTGLFTRIPARRTGEKTLREVHDPHFVEYLRKICAELPPNKSIYPIIFPIRNLKRPPKDTELQVGYYCIDTFTPINRNAWLAARGAVNCAVTGAELILGGSQLAYALVRPPGHHAEKRSYGGFCYFNSAAVAAQFLSKTGKVAILDIDFHHGNGTQDIFYSRADVFTVSIHGNPKFAYPHFSGFADETGEGEGKGFNLNLPLPETITPEKYRETLQKALNAIKKFSPRFLVLALGLDTAKADPTGTWPLKAEDFRLNGQIIGSLKLPILIVQEGGYRTRTLGINAARFFEGLYSSCKNRI